jgi:hypothetical protein
MRRTTNFACLAALSVAVEGSIAIAGNEPTEGSCSVVSSDSSGVNATIPVGALHVISATASTGPFLLPSGITSSAKAVSDASAYPGQQAAIRLDCV